MVLGPTNVGKSALVAALTNAAPEVAEIPFTTWQPTPGMMPVENIQVQLIDTPSLDRDYVEPELLDLIRRSDMLLLVVDVHADPVQQLEDTISFLGEHRIVPLHLRDRNPMKERQTYIPVLVLANKSDDEVSDENFEIFCELLETVWPLLPVSAVTGRNSDRLGQEIFEKLDVIRIYSKAPGKDPDLQSPFVMEKGGTVEEFARKIHQDFYENLKSARVWGSADFDGQMVGRDYVLQDGDVVELRI